MGPPFADSIDEVQRLPRLLLFGLQHVLVMYAGTVAVPLILGSAPQFTLSMGVLPIASPQLFAHAPDVARLFLNSGIFLTAAIAVLLNLFFSSKAEG